MKTLMLKLLAIFGLQPISQKEDMLKQVSNKMKSIPTTEEFYQSMATEKDLEEAIKIIVSCQSISHRHSETIEKILAFNASAHHRIMAIIIYCLQKGHDDEKAGHLNMSDIEEQIKRILE